LDLNSKLFNQQLVLQDREQKNLQKVQWIDSFRRLCCINILQDADS
jgi:hypothetical protein